MYSAEQLAKETTEFIKNCDRQPVVCLDYFDTLVRRTVMPEHTKKIAAKQMAILLGKPGTGEEIYGLRSQVERDLCLSNEALGYDLEFTIDDCGRTIFERLSQNPVIDLTDIAPNEFVKEFVAIEMAVEKQVQKLCPDMLELVGSIRSQKTKTILVSDFYLPKCYFIELLKFHGIYSLFDDVFISSDYLITKGSGRLYGKIIEDLNLNPNIMVMIGDNDHADRMMAESVGITGLTVDRSIFREEYQVWADSQKTKKQREHKCHERCLDILTDDESGVFPELALTIHHFITLLFSQMIKDGVTTAFFLSREGEFLKKVFDAYQITCFGRLKIKTHYLVVSRKSTYIASLKSLETERFDKLFYQYRDISPVEFLQSLNFSHAQAAEICTLLRVNKEERVSDFPNSEIFQNLLNEPLFRELYEKFRSEQKSNFQEYLEAIAPQARREGIALVDVGWKGSIQDNIFGIYDHEVEIKGYYLGLLTAGLNHPKNFKKGVIFYEIPKPSEYFSVYNNNRALLEIILGASHGSADGYYRSAEEIEQNRDEDVTVQFSIMITNGMLFIATTEEEEERELFKTVIEPLQRRMFKMNLQFQALSLTSEASGNDRRWFAKHHARMVFTPTKKEISFFEEMYHLENFGVFEFTRFKSENNLRWRRKLFNLYSVIKDPALLEIGFWPPVILRHMGIGFYHRVDGLIRHYKAFGLKALS